MDIRGWLDIALSSIAVIIMHVWFIYYANTFGENVCINSRKPKHNARLTYCIACK